MNEEEKKAVEYSKNCLMKITLGIDCEFDVNILDTLLNIIKKLQKENEELKNIELKSKGGAIKVSLDGILFLENKIKQLEKENKELELEIKNRKNNISYA